MCARLFSKLEIEGLVEPFIFRTLEKDAYEVNTIPSESLLVWNRLDLAFKLAYLTLRDKNTALAQEVYLHDIRAQTLGTFREIGNPDKSSWSSYLRDFDKTYLDIQKNGFDSRKTLIPLAWDGSIINGAHRVAAAIHANVQVHCIQTERARMVCDYEYFYKRNVPEDILNIAVNTFITYAPNTYLAFLWPSGSADKLESTRVFTNVVVRREMKLTSTGAFNLLVQLYKHMDWVGNSSDGFKGVTRKLIECFPHFGEVSVLVFQADSLDEVRKLKESVRSIHGIGYSSIHITDTKEEAVRIGRLIFNRNGLHFLNHARPHKFDFQSRLEPLHRLIARGNAHSADLVIDGGAVLALYGIRNAQDIDYVSTQALDEPAPGSLLDNHEIEVAHHGHDKREIIYDPRLYFEYEGLKYVSFDQLYYMKARRADSKDKNDLVAMRALVMEGGLVRELLRMKQACFYFRIKVMEKSKSLFFSFLQSTYLYRPVRVLYRAFRGQKFKSSKDS
jgi:hypothetical protein